MVEAEVWRQLAAPLWLFSRPENRVFWAYLLCSAVLAGWVLWRQERPLWPALRQLLTGRWWRQPSVWLDVQWIFLNNALWVLLIAPWLGSQVALAVAGKNLLQSVFGEGNLIQASVLAISLSYTVVLWVADDFTRFLLHRAYHRLPWLWRFHAVHHSATVLTPLTLYRVHSLEMLLNGLRSLWVAGLVGALFIYLVDGRITPVTLLGANLFSLAFNVAGSNLRHSPVWLSFGRFEHCLMSPAQHQIHHSDRAEHVDKNFGVMIPLWDKWFGSWLASDGQTVEAFGLRKPVRQSLLQQLGGIR
ncbi:MAG TPA: sterol desaturase family protein [Pseudomonadales bacterium]